MLTRRRNVNSVWAFTNQINKSKQTSLHAYWISVLSILWLSSLICYSHSLIKTPSLSKQSINIKWCIFYFQHFKKVIYHNIRKNSHRGVRQIYKCYDTCISTTCFWKCLGQSAIWYTFTCLNSILLFLYPVHIEVLFMQ